VDFLRGNNLAVGGSSSIGQEGLVDVGLDYRPQQKRIHVAAPAGGGEMAYLDFGPEARPPDVVFLHANGFNARAYRTILAPLASSLRILAPDQRGHGATKLPTDHPRTTWEDLKDDLLAFLETLGLGRVALAGHSMGGTASLLAAAEAPEQARALVLLDPVILPPTLEVGRLGGDSPMVQGALRRRRIFPNRATAVEAYRGRGAFRTWNEAMLEDYVAAGFHDRPDGTVELACSPEWEVSNYVNQGHDSWWAFERSVCPIRILRAEHESPGRIDDRLEALTASGRIRIETVPGTTHFLPMERPELVRQAILEAVTEA
jgi:pimeloyl-ACP methyl ester carboxylesterase